MAACLMLSGVGKSGSPAPKSTTSTPSARSFAASAATFMVEDSLIDDIRSAIALATACMVFLRPFMLNIRQPALQPLFHGGRHQPGDIPAQTENFLHQAGADKRI